MARLKTAYREREAPVESIIAPPVESLGEQPVSEALEAEPVSLGVEPSTGEPEAYPEDAAIAEAVQADEARISLKQQIEDLRRSEQQLRALQEQAASQRLPSRDELLAMWKQQGASDKELKFLADNPELIDHPQVTALAAYEAARLHPHGSEEHMAATKRIFHERMNGHATELQTTPEFFQPPAPRLPAERNMGSIVSAPVSREAPGAAGGYSEPSPSRIHLSAAEVEIAKSSGISPRQYAENKMRMLRERRNGERQ